MAINGVGTGWDSAVPVLTAGGVSIADSYHTHHHNNLLDIRYTTANVVNLSTLTAGSGSIADSLHTHTHDQLSDIRTTTAVKSNLLTLTAGSGSIADSLHTHSSPTVATYNSVTPEVIGVGMGKGTWYKNQTLAPMFVTVFCQNESNASTADLVLEIHFSSQLLIPSPGSTPSDDVAPICSDYCSAVGSGDFFAACQISFVVPSARDWCINLKSALSGATATTKIATFTN